MKCSTPVILGKVVQTINAFSASFTVQGNNDNCWKLLSTYYVVYGKGIIVPSFQIIQGFTDIR